MKYTVQKWFKKGFLAIPISLYIILVFSFPSFAQIIEGVDYSSRSDVYRTFDMAGQDIFGQRFASENYSYKDPVTNIDVIALTTSRHNNSKIYQDRPQWTSDGLYLVFRSSRADGQYYAMSMSSFEIVQITTGKNNQLVHLGWNNNMAYQLRERELIELNLAKLLADSENGIVTKATDYERVIATLPPGVRETSGVALDANEQRLFFIHRLEKQHSAIYSIDFESAKVDKLIEVPFWANHLQANRWVSGEVMYSWETGGDSPQRIWSMAVGEDGVVVNRPLYEESDEEWVTHEVFMNADHIVFNVMGHIDRLNKNPNGIFILNIRTNELTRLEQAGKGGYWHAYGTEDLKWVVGDTFDGNLYRIDVEASDVRLLTTGHRPNGPSPFTREAHSHHSISPDGKWVLFNSSLFTSSDIMLLPLHPKDITLPKADW